MKRLITFLLILSLAACSPKPSDNNEDPNDDTNEDPIIEEVTHRSIFNGEEIEENQKTYQAFAIMISNSAEARPHSSLGLADVVYEIAVETYTITRFMAIFQSEMPDKVGPARSARIPFVRMMQEWGIPFGHFGSAATGQGDAKSLIEAIKPPIRFDGHQGINSQYFYRSNDRVAPHNAYFNAERAIEKIPELEYEKHFDFDDSSNIDDQEVTSLSLRYSSYNPVSYEYDQETNSYNRFIKNQPMMDAYTNKQIAVRNIIVQHAPHTTAESVSYVLVDFVGEGKAEYFVGGYYEEGTWKKESHEAVTQFFDSEGEPIVLLPGNTWIQVVHPNVGITFE